MSLFGLPGGAEAWRPIEVACDPYTLRILDSVIGVSPGWRCCDVGAGAGSVARALHDRAGTVVALDADTRYLEPLQSGSFSVVEADVESAELPADLDLLHARFLLDLLADPRAIIEKFISALRPGGWLFLEEWDECTQAVSMGDSGLQQLHARVVAAKQRTWAEAGLDSFLGRKLPDWLGSLHLLNVDSECGGWVHRGATADVTPWRDSLRRSRSDLLQAGLSATELDRYLEHLDSGAISFFSPLVVRAWGQRPPVDQPVQ